MSSFTWLAMGLATLSLFYYSVAWCLTMAWHGWPRRPLQGSFRPGVSILKPLSGVDEELEQNLRSFFELDYEPLQLLFCARDAEDPGLNLAIRLAEQYPARDTRILHGGNDEGASPKIANFERMYPAAVHDLVMLSDSNVRIEPTDLDKIVQAFADPRVGLSYQPVTAIGERTPAAAVENLRLTELGGFFTIAIRVFAQQHTVMGKGIVCRREALQAIGVFSQLRDLGADDFSLACRVRRAGWKLQMSRTLARAIHRDWSWSAFWSRHTRHSAMRIRLCWWSYPLELLFSPPLMAIPCLLTGTGTGVAAGLVVVAFKTLLDAVAMRRLRGTPLTWRLFPWLVLKDLIGLAVWCGGLATRHVRWRGRTYRLGREARLIPAP